MSPRRYEPAGPLALDPKAFGLMLLMPYVPVTTERNGVIILSVRGPLVQFRDVFCESYEALVERVDAALANRPRALVLSLASPGGSVAGCFETARHIRAAAVAAGVPLVSYVDGGACSAAYALACAADCIVAPPTATVGSIGVIAQVVDASSQVAAQGIQVRMLKNGARKADAVPAVQATGEGLVALQSAVDRLAVEFFSFVGERRRISPDALRALEAASFIGADAQSMGLTDATQTLDELLSSIDSGQTPAPAKGASQESQMQTKTSATGAKATTDTATASKAEDEKEYEAAIASLRKAAAAGDERAKRMLAAELADEDEGKDPPEADAPPPPAKDESKGDDKKDEKDAKAVANEALATAQAARRDAMLASRPDITPELRASLEKLPPDSVKEILAATPVTKAKLGAAAATAVVGGTLAAGKGEGDSATTVTPERAEMRARMGLDSGLGGIRREGTAMIFGVADVSAPTATK